MNGLAWGPGGGLPSDGPSTIRQQAGLASRAAQARTPPAAAQTAASPQRAIDLCRAEVRTLAERDYNLRNIDITAAAVDAAAGRSDWVSGNFSDRTGYFRRAGGYRFNSPMDYNSGRARTIEILRADGTVLQPGSASGTSTPYTQAGFDQTRVSRACEDAVVVGTARDGYQNVNFRSTAVDNDRSGLVSGIITAARGPVTAR